jgi:hypothetical protein
MDEIVLVDDMEMDNPVFDVVPTTHRPAAVTGADAVTVAGNGSRTGTSNASAPVAASLNQPVFLGAGNKRYSDGEGVASVIMMYSPDIPACSDGGRFESRPSIANYYALIDTEETMKCIVSTTLICIILVAFVLIAVLLNPEM